MAHPTVVSVLLSASVERCFVSRMRDFFRQIFIILFLLLWKIVEINFNDFNLGLSKLSMWIRYHNIKTFNIKVMESYLVESKHEGPGLVHAPSVCMFLCELINSNKVCQMGMIKGFRLVNMVTKNSSKMSWQAMQIRCGRLSHKKILTFFWRREPILSSQPQNGV